MQKDQRHSTYLLILLSIAILLFFTKGAYSDLQVQLSEKDWYIDTVEKLEREKNNLGSIKTEMSDENSSQRQEIARYVNEFTEQAMLNYFYSYASNTEGRFNIQSLWLDRKDENEFGFQEGTIDLTVSAETQWDVLRFLKVILEDDAPYRFFIEKFDMPKQVEWRNLELSIPLKIFYK